MDNWQVAQNYLVAAAIGGAVGGYYYYTAQRKPNRTGALITPRRSETDLRGRNTRQKEESTRQNGSSAARKRKAPQPKPEPVVEHVADDKPAKESDTSAVQFAKQMQQARQGANLLSGKSNETRVKTVKPKAAPGATDSLFGDDDPETLEVASVSAGGVSDMLEPAAPAPTTLRITAPAEAQKQKVARPPKQEVVESKKQRQNRKKMEERKALREQEERERKVLEERQRRTARQARGEPAKNGVAQTKVPAVNAWEQRSGDTTTAAEAVPASQVMLDTFDAESTSSSNGGHGVSTAATSTTSGEQPRWDEEHMAAAIKQSGDDAGWTTVSAPAKKQTKKNVSGLATAVTEQATSQTRSGAYAALESSAD